MSLAIFATPRYTFQDDNGGPASGWLLYTYEPGTSTPKATYLDYLGSQANTNPVVLDARGEAVIYMDGAYKFVLTDAAGVVKRTEDNVTGVGDKVQSGYLSKNVAGSGNITLTHQEQNNSVIELTGALTGNINVTVDDDRDGYRWVVKNSTSGSYSITFKTVSGSGVIIAQGVTYGLYCNASSVVKEWVGMTAAGTAADKYLYTTAADTWTEGAITSVGRTLLSDATAAAQRASLGSTAVGDALFIASSQASAQSSIGLSPDIFSVTATVATNALTITLVAPLSITFRNATLNNGAPVTVAIANNLSITVPETATLGTTNNVAARIVFLVAYNGGTPVLCVTNLAGGLSLDGTTLISPTTISASATAANVIYSASAVGANSPFRVVGFCDITEATAGTWATGPTTVQGVGGQALAALSSIGYGQTWQDVTASRAVATTYYNTTGKPIQVSIIGKHATAGGLISLAITVSGVPVGLQEFDTDVGGAPYATVTAIVPPGASYSASITNTLHRWVELR